MANALSFKSDKTYSITSSYIYIRSWLAFAGGSSRLLLLDKVSHQKEKWAGIFFAKKLPI